MFWRREKYLTATVGVKNGNPQSSALCPILFTDFINGMVQRSVLCPILFTDFINGMVQRSALCPILFTDFINGVTQRSALCPILLTHFINGVAQRSALCQIPFTEKVHYVQYCLRTLLTEWPRKVRRLAFVAHVCVMPWANICLLFIGKEPAYVYSLLVNSQPLSTLHW